MIFRLGMALLAGASKQVSARFLARYCDKGRFSALFKINFCDNLSVKITLINLFYR
jgi:hypothetical protein